MKELIFCLYLVYMSINLYTDSKRLETYNRVHLAAGIAFTALYFVQDYSFSRYVVIVIVTLILGIIAENTPFMKMGAGDTKMLVVSAIYLGIFTPIKGWVLPFLLFLGFKMLISFIVVTLSLMFLLQNKHRKSEVLVYKAGHYKLTWVFKKGKLPAITTSVPATGGILLATMTLLLLFQSN